MVSHMKEIDVTIHNRSSEGLKPEIKIYDCGQQAQHAGFP